jgi:hypothetical protein
MRNESEHEELLRKLKKMHKFTKDLLEKVEECCEMEEDYDEDYREEEPHEKPMYRGSYRRMRYRRSM